MAGCDEMKVGEVYTCLDCGLEVKVAKACTPEGAEACGCKTQPNKCALSCCGKELTLEA